METLSDIVAQIRAAAYIQNADTPKSVLRIADRIEAAWRRNVVELNAVLVKDADFERNKDELCRARAALAPWISLAEWLIKNAGKDALGQGVAEMVPALRARIDESRAVINGRGLS